VIRENPASRGTETSAEVLVGPPWRMVSNAGQQQWYTGVFFTVATVITVAANAERRFRGPGKLAAGRADVCPPMALNASQSATPSAPTADVQSAAGCDDQQ